MKKLKFMLSKKGVISLFGVLVALISVIMLCGYLDLTQTTHVMEEVQSIMDLTALSTLQGSVDAEGVRFDRMTLRYYDHFVPNPATGKSPADEQKVTSETDKDMLLTLLKADGNLAGTTIWIDGTNADNVDQIEVRKILLKNFNYYLQKLLYTGEGDATQPLLDYTSSNITTTNDYNKNSIIKRYEIREFNAELIYSSWGVDAQTKEGYQKIPQAYIDTTIILYLAVEPTFSSMNVSIEESHVYNALTSSNSSSKLHVEGYTDDGLLVISIRTLARMTVQGFIASEDTPDISDITVSYDSIPYTPEEYFDITSTGVVTGFSEAYYLLPVEERPTAIKMPVTIRGITPVAIDERAFEGSDDKIVMMILPQSITHIGDYAFAGASYLKDFGFIGTSKLASLGEGVFQNCSALLHFVSPNGLKVIPPKAFENCSNMTAFSFSKELTTIGDNAFNNCARLKGTLQLPDSVTTIGSKAFFDCQNIVTLIIPKELTNLGSAAFGKMIKLNAIKMTENDNFLIVEDTLYRLEPDGTYSLVLYPAQRTFTSHVIPLINSKLVTRIEDYAFYGNIYLQEIYYKSDIEDEEDNMLHGIRKVGESAFEKCTALKTLQFAGDLTNGSGNIIRPGLNSIGANAFTATSSLSLVYIDKLKNTVSGSPWGANTDITTIRWKADDGFNWSKVYSYTDAGVIQGLTAYGAKLVLEENLELIIPEVLEDAQRGTTIVRAIGNNAFSCRVEDAKYAEANQKIFKMEIAAKLESIGQNAFRGTKLTTFILPEEVATVGNYAFAESAITSFEIKGGTELSIGDGAFMGSALQSFKLTEDVVALGAGVFKDCISLGQGTGKFEFEANLAALPDYTFSGCTSLKSVVIPASVKTIGAYAFEKCSTLTSIGTLQDIEHVKTYAFTGCESLAQLVFTSNIKTIEEMAFYNATGLLEVMLYVEEDAVLGKPWGAPNYTKIIWLNSIWVKYYTYEQYNSTNKWRITGLSPLGIEALRTSSLVDFETPTHRAAENGDAWEIVSLQFRASDYEYLKNLRSMKLNVAYRGGYELYPGVFQNCTSLQTVTLPTGISKIGDNAFKGCIALEEIDIPSDVTSLGQSAFEGCESLTMASLGAGITDLKTKLFKGCTDLEQVVLIADVTSIGTSAFESCSSLPTFHIKKTVSNIGDYAFYGCTNLRTVTSADDAALTTIKTGVFEDCSRLETIDLPIKVTLIKDSAFKNCEKLNTIANYDRSALTTIEQNAFSYCKSLATLQNFSKLSSIGEFAFGESGVVTIKTQTSLTTIGDTAFKDCKKLTTVEKQSSLATLGASAFEGCTSLAVVHPMDSLTSMGNRAFALCTALKELKSFDALGTISTEAFYGCSNLTTYPEENAVKKINHNAFADCTSLQTIKFGTGIGDINDNTFNGCSALTAIYINRSEYNDYQTNTGRSKNVKGSYTPNSRTGPKWGSPNSTVIYWNNTLKINGVNARGNAILCYENIIKLDAKTAKKSLTLEWLYNGDVDDLVVTKDSEIDSATYHTVSRSNNGNLSFTFNKSTSRSYYFYALSDIYGNDGRVKVNVDDTIELELDSVILNPYLNSSNVGIFDGERVAVYYSGSAGDLSITQNPTAKYAGASLVSPQTSGADKTLSVTAGGAGVGCSGRTSVTVGDGKESATLEIEVVHAMKLVGDNPQWFDYGKNGYMPGFYSGAWEYASVTDSSSNIATAKASSPGAMAVSVVCKAEGSVTLTDAGSSNDSSLVASATQTVRWHDYWSNATDTASLTWSYNYGTWLSSDGISGSLTDAFKYVGPYNEAGYFFVQAENSAALVGYAPNTFTVNKYEGTHPLSGFEIQLYRSSVGDFGPLIRGPIKVTLHDTSGNQPDSSP